jgi:hypothetical protein
MLKERCIFCVRQCLHSRIGGQLIRRTYLLYLFTYFQLYLRQCEMKIKFNYNFKKYLSAFIFGVYFYFNNIFIIFCVYFTNLYLDYIFKFNFR